MCLGADAPSVDSHLVGWWKFDETSGDNAADSSKQDHKGVLEGKLSFDQHSAAGRIGKAISLDGQQQCIRIAGFKGITGAKPRTIAAWVKTNTPGGEIISWGENDFGKMFVFGFVRGRVGLVPRGGYLYMKNGVHDDAWHHVAVIVEEASPPNLHDHVKLYLDGEAAVIDDIGLLDLWPIETGEKQDVIIGRRFKGQLDDLRMYDTALSADQIKGIFKQAK